MNNEDLKIWRYLSLAKFISILEDKALYFTRSDRFKDPLDGRYLPGKDPRGTYILAEDKAKFQNGEEKTIKKVGGQPVRDLADSQRPSILINCWQINENESSVMWNSLKSDDGIAIQSSLHKLEKALKGQPNTIIRPVKYLDYDVEEPPSTNLFDVFFHKRAMFTDERELRIVVHSFAVNGQPVEHGALIPIDISLLIEAVYISPNAESWLTTLLQKIQIKYELDKPIIPSKFYKPK